MPDTNETTFEIRQIEPGDRLTGLSLGDVKFVALKTFLQKQAKSYHSKSLAKTYAVFTDAAKVVAYVTLVCGEIAADSNEADIVQDPELIYRYDHYPAVKIARLAVHENYRGFSIGRKLVDLALGISKEQICPAVGCRFVVVDSKKEAVDFYVKMGFTMLDTDDNKAREEPVMFIDLMKV